MKTRTNDRTWELHLGLWERFRERSSAGLAMLEFTIFAAFIAVILAGFSVYLTRYLAEGEEAEVQQSLQLGRLAAIPNIVVRDSSGNIVPDPSVPFGTLVSDWLKSSFVSQTALRTGGNGCLASGDYLSLTMQYTPPFAVNTTTGLPDASGKGVIIPPGSLSGIFDCTGTERSDIGTAELTPILSKVDRYAENTAGRQNVFIVVWSHKFPSLPAFVVPTDTVSYEGRIAP